MDMPTKRRCVETFTVSNARGDESFTIEQDAEYLTSEPVNGTVTVFSSYWVKVPARIFGLTTPAQPQPAIETLIATWRKKEQAHYDLRDTKARIDASRHRLEASGNAFGMCATDLESMRPELEIEQERILAPLALCAVHHPDLWEAESCPICEGQLLADRVGELEGALASETQARQEAEKALEKEEHSHGQTIDQREAFHDAADELAYAIAPLDVIGEHSNMNDPWENALDALESERAEHEAKLTAEREARQQAEKAVEEWSAKLAAEIAWRIDAQTALQQADLVIVELGVKHGQLLNECHALKAARQQAEQERADNLVQQAEELIELRAQLAASERARAQAETEREALRTALETLKANAECSLKTTGQRVGVPMFVPSVAKRVLEIVEPALSAAQARETFATPPLVQADIDAHCERPATDPDWPERVG